MSVMRTLFDEPPRSFSVLPRTGCSPVLIAPENLIPNLADVLHFNKCFVYSWLWARLSLSSKRALDLSSTFKFLRLSSSVCCTWVSRLVILIQDTTGYPQRGVHYAPYLRCRTFMLTFRCTPVGIATTCCHSKNHSIPSISPKIAWFNQLNALSN